MKNPSNSKRIFILSALLLGGVFALTACSKAPATGANPQNPSQSASGTPQAKGAGRNRMPDFGQPSRPADIRGVVKSITGNEADILVVNMGDGRGGQNASSTPNANASGTKQAPAISLGGSGAGRQGGFGGYAGGQGGRGGSGGAGGGGAADPAAMLARLKAMSTGEDTVVIPVGIKMLKSSTDANNKRTYVEASLSDVVSDKTVTIWLNSSVTDKKVAEFVLIN
jgi:hypothetical protein